MDFDYHEDHSTQRDLRDETPADARYAQRLIIAVTVIVVALLLLGWLTGTTLETVPPA